MGKKPTTAATPKAPPKKNGRPVKLALSIEDKVEGAKDDAGALMTVGQILENLGSVLCTQREVASILRVTEKTLIEFFRREPKARELYARGCNMGKISLRRKQFALADKNATMAIFLGMQILDQKDKREHGFKGLPSDFNRMSTDQLVHLLGVIEQKLSGQARLVSPSSD